jgi:periplasmic glucans biosynthesis protein
MRLHLTFALITAILLVITLHYRYAHQFGFEQVDKLAADHAKAPYVPMPNLLPPQLQKLTPQQEAGIFWKDTYRLWRKKGLPFQVDFYHLSKAFPFAPQIDTVDRKGAHLLAYSPSFFNFSGLTFNPPLPNNLGYAGFYLRYPNMIQGSKPGSLDGFFTTQGGSYYRAIARDQVYGLSARGLAINTAVPGKNGERGKTEEFPFFTQWWLHEPAPNATEEVIDALLDSPSVAGAYEFHIRPGDRTAVDVHASLYFRKDVTQIGFAPFSSMYLFGENAKDHHGDTFHPEIHDSDGLLIDNGHGEWSWQPLQQQRMQQFYPIDEDNPAGFGLLQRDRQFDHYQDKDLLYNVRPSAWIVPQGNWGKGKVTLFQLPSDTKDTDNVILFWQPEHLPKAGDHVTLDYTVEFYMNDAERPPLAYTRSTLINEPAPPPAPPPLPPGAPPIPPNPAPSSTPARPAAAPSPATPKPGDPTVPVQFVIDFVGNGIENLPANQPPDLDLSADPPETILRDKSVEKNGYDNSWRVTFTVDPYKFYVPTVLRCRLLSHNTVGPLRDEIDQINHQISTPAPGTDPTQLANLRNSVLPQKQKALQDAETRPLTETWTYTWHQGPDKK